MTCKKNDPRHSMLTAILMLFPISMNVKKTLTHTKASGGLDVEGRSVEGEHCSHDSSPVINTTHTPAHTRGKTNTGPPITSVSKTQQWSPHTVKQEADFLLSGSTDVRRAKYETGYHAVSQTFESCLGATQTGWIPLHT